MKIFAIISLIAGVILLFGSIGAMENFNISFEQGVLQLIIAFVLFLPFVGYELNKRIS